jgi:flavin-dependent dehydrogenase
MTSNHIYDVAIAGGGPAGTSAAIRLAQQGLTVLLMEQKKFPRGKLCGEFISPECVNHFEQLGVAEDIFAANGARLTETSFYSRHGRKVTVPSNWFEDDRMAIGLSRAEMDHLLLETAKRAGVTVLEEAQVTDLILETHHVCGVRVRLADGMNDYRAHLTIDATGRTRALARKIDKAPKQQPRAKLVAFKAHVENAQVKPGACEIYFYPGGYGGLSNIEDGLSNLCFIAAASDVRHCGSDPEEVMKSTVLRNSRAQLTLADAKFAMPWLSVALESFGRHTLVPATGLLMIGDAAAFIDPFTGSGMLMALESGAVAAQSITESRHYLSDAALFSEIANRYRTNYAKAFNSRLRVSGWLRRAAFIPRLAETAMICFGASENLRRNGARATRQPWSGKRV